MAKSPVVRFYGERSLFSNFYQCDVSALGVVFHSVEAAYQFKKAIFHGDFATAEYIKNAPSGRVAKRRSKHIFQTRSCWVKVRLAVMRALVRDKFRTKEFRKALLETGDAEIIEWVPSREGYWGVSLGFKEGMNVMGRILMRIREEARADCDVATDMTRSSSR